MKLLRALFLSFLGTTLIASLSADHHGNKLYSGEPIKALIVTGGCCHNYHFQTSAMTEGISKVADVNWTILHEVGISKDHQSEF